MSTPSDVIRDLATLVQDLAALLETQTAREIPNIARDLGAQPQLATGVDALGQVLGHRADRRINQHRTIKHRRHDNTGREGRADLFELFGGFGRHRAAVATCKHQGGANHSAMTIDAGCTRADLAARRNGRHINDPHRRPATLGNHDIGNFRPA